MRLSRLSVPLLALLAACSGPAGQSAAQPGQGPGAFGSGLPLPETNRAPPANFTTMKMSFAPIVRRAAPAVVNISSRRIVRTQVDPFFEFFGGGFGVPRARIEGSLGSGVIVRADGVIVTNNHVVEGGQEITVSLADRREFPAKVMLADPRSDLAVLKIDTKGERLPVMPIEDRNDVQVGDLVLAIGDPFGVGQTVTNGIVSGLARTELGASNFSSYIQTDAAINPGNSGGALVDMNGNLLGINTFILSRSGTSSGVGFAIPAPLVRRVVEAAVGGGRTVARPWIGARTQTVDAETARSLGLDRAGGVLISSLYPGGPAANAGLRAGDLITAADGQPVADQGALNYAVATHRPGETLRLEVRRGAGVGRTVTVRLEAPPATPPRDERTLAGRQPLSGATVVNLSPATADEYGLDPLVRGVLITKVSGIAAQLGFAPGDIVRSVNGRPVATTAELAAAAQRPQGGWSVTIDRNGETVTATF